MSVIIPVYNEEADKITGTEQNVTQPSTENAPDMSEYIKKEDVEALYVRKDEVQTMIDEAVEKVKGELSGKQQTAQKGPKGDPGRGISAVVISERGDQGERGERGIPGQKGEKGDKGEDGNSATNPTEDYLQIGYSVPVIVLNDELYSYCVNQAEICGKEESV